MNAARIEGQRIVYPLPSDQTICPECFGVSWSDAECPRCDDRGYVECLAHNEEPGCECADCKAYSAQMFADYKRERSILANGCRNCGEIGCLRCAPVRFA